MANLFSPGLTVSSRHTVVKRRELPMRGEILVRVGDMVAGDQNVARAELEGELRIVRVSEQLGIVPEDVAKYLCIEKGQQVSSGEVVAEMRGLWGLFRSVVSSPIGGTIEFISTSTGHIGVRAAPKPLDLPAYIDGRVLSIDEGRAVVIEAHATFVQGIFGVGGERRGRLKLLDVRHDSKIDYNHIPDDVAGCVLVGGHSPTLAALRKAADNGAVGFVTGSLSGATLHDYLGYDIGIALTGDEAVSMTVIVTEGFGTIAMGERVLSTLRSVDGAMVSINGATQVRAGAQRPEIIAPPSNAPDSGERGHEGLRVGARVRVIRVPYFGVIGHVESLPQQLTKIETGAETRVLTIMLADGKSITVPRANVELLS